MDKSLYPTILMAIKLSLTGWSLYNPVSSILVTGQLIFIAVDDLQSWRTFLYVKRRKHSQKTPIKTPKNKSPQTPWVNTYREEAKRVNS